MVEKDAEATLKVIDDHMEEHYGDDVLLYENERLLKRFFADIQDKLGAHVESDIEEDEDTPATVAVARHPTSILNAAPSSSNNTATVAAAQHPTSALNAVALHVAPAAAQPGERRKRAHDSPPIRSKPKRKKASQMKEAQQSTADSQDALITSLLEDAIEEDDDSSESDMGGEITSESEVEESLSDDADE